MSVTLEDILDAVHEVQQEYTDEDMVRWFSVEGWGPSKIARVMGIHRATVYRRLQRLGAYRPPGRFGPERKEWCKRGHLMSEHGVEVPVKRGGGRYCRKCKTNNARLRRGLSVED